MSDSEKRCSKCKTVKPVDRFHRDGSRPDGRQPRCKTCQQEAARRWYEANRERTREAGRRWRKANVERVRELKRQWHAANREREREYKAAWREANLERERESKRAWRAKNPLRSRAHGIVQKAVERGALANPGRCVWCGGGERVEGHHENYRDPLTVFWLCRECHRRHHAEMRNPGDKRLSA